MSVDRTLDVFRYALPIETSVPGVGGRREGLVLRLSNGDGATGFGEAAPLHGFSRETMRDVEALFADQPEQMRLAQLVTQCGALCSTSFAIDCAVRGWEARTARTEATGSFLRTYALAGLADARGMERGLAEVDAGANLVKFKIGVGRTNEESALIRLFLSRTKESVQLILDANRRWNYEQAVGFWHNTGAARILYVEEPIREVSRLHDLRNETQMPIALDESVVRRDTEAFDPAVAAAVVIKPMLVGNWETCEAIARAAARSGCEVTVTTAFESGVGTLGVAMLAAHLKSQGLDPFVGLDTYQRLAADVLTPRLRLGVQSIDVEALTAPRYTLASDRLEHLKTISVTP